MVSQRGASVWGDEHDARRHQCLPEPIGPARCHRGRCRQLRGGVRSDDRGLARLGAQPRCGVDRGRRRRGRRGGNHQPTVGNVGLRCPVGAADGPFDRPQPAGPIQPHRDHRVRNGFRDLSAPLRVTGGARRSADGVDARLADPQPAVLLSSPNRVGWRESASGRSDAHLPHATLAGKSIHLRHRGRPAPPRQRAAGLEACLDQHAGRPAGLPHRSGRHLHGGEDRGHQRLLPHPAGDLRVA